MSSPYSLVPSAPYAASTVSASASATAAAAAHAALPDCDCHDCLVRTIIGIGGPLATMVAGGFTASQLVLDIQAKEQRVQESLGVLEIYFVQRSIPNDLHTEGFIDLLAAYQALMFESQKSRSALRDLAGWRQRITLVGPDMKITRRSVERLDALLNRVKSSIELAEMHSRTMTPATPVVLPHYPSTSSIQGWTCPFRKLGDHVEHIWIYDKSGYPLTKKHTKYMFAKAMMIPEVPYGRHDRPAICLAQGGRFHSWVYNSRKQVIYSRRDRQYDICTDPFTHHSYLRLLPIDEATQRPRYPWTVAPPNWTRETPEARVAAPAAPAPAPAPAYHPPEPNQTRAPAHHQPARHPGPSTGLPQTQGHHVPAAQYAYLEPGYSGHVITHQPGPLPAPAIAIAPTVMMPTAAVVAQYPPQPAPANYHAPPQHQSSQYITRQQPGPSSGMHRVHHSHPYPGY